MKKILQLFSFALIFTFAACNSNSNGEAVNKKVESGHKILIAYFSYSGTTEKVANLIHQNIAGDIVRIEAVEPYPQDQATLSKQAAREQKENFMPPLKTKIENFDEYDTIIIGYPIWQGTFPQPVASFLKEYDFSGKTIVPFCTYGGTGIGGTVSRIQELAPDSTVLEALGVDDANAGNERGAVKEWLKKIGIK